VVWVDQAGRKQPTGFDGRPWSQPRLSPDGRRILAAIGPVAGTGASANDLWPYDYALMDQAPLVSYAEVVASVRDRELGGRGIGWVDAHLLASALVG